MALYDLIKDAAKIAQKANNIELYKQLSDISDKVRELQSEVTRLTYEIEKMKKDKDIESHIERHQELFITLNNDKDPILYCSHCWDSEHKLIQMYTNNGKYSCPHCKVNNVYDKQQYEESRKKNMNSISEKLSGL